VTQKALIIVSPHLDKALSNMLKLNGGSGSIAFVEDECYFFELTLDIAAARFQVA
jgi:hypothetical protein